MKKFQQFMVKENAFMPTTDISAQNSINPGLYELGVNKNGDALFIPKEINTEKYIDLPSSITSKIIENIRHFWSGDTKVKYDNLNIVYKRGILMYGAPGTGKTATVMALTNRVIAEGGIAIYNPDARLFSGAIKALRDIQGDCKVVCVLEEFDKHCKSADFLGLLDGELQVPNVVFLATTNYIDTIPDNIKKRPSRFSLVVEVGPPSREAREVFLMSKLPGKDISQLVKHSEGMVIDQIKELVVSTECFGLSVSDAANNIKKLGSKAFIGIKSKEDHDHEDTDIFGRRLVLNTDYGVK